MTECLVDTNILIYAVEKNYGKHDLASEVVMTLLEKKEFVTSVQNLAEFSRVLLEKSKKPPIPEDVIKYVLRYKSLGKIVTYGSETVARAIAISKEYQIHFFDALIVATMQENGISEIVTENTSDFKKINWLKVTNPFSLKYI